MCLTHYSNVAKLTSFVRDMSTKTKVAVEAILYLLLGLWLLVRLGDIGIAWKSCWVGTKKKVPCARYYDLIENPKMSVGPHRANLSRY